jgi:hypothetical protein
MWAGLTSSARDILTRSHRVSARIRLFGPTGSQFEPILLSGGQVTIDATAQVRRSAQIYCDPNLWPRSPFDLLAPFGSYGYIDYGIGLPDGTTLWVPLGKYFLDQNQRQRPVNSNTYLTVTLSDQTSRIIEDRATSPIQTLSGATCASEIARIIQLTDPSIYVYDSTGDTTVAPQIVISQDKWQDGIQVLADAIGSEVFTLQDGSGFIIRKTPTILDAPVWTVECNTPNSSVITTSETVDRANVYNQFVVSGILSDGTVSVTAIVQDTDPNSPTYIGGSFGKRTRYYSSALITTSAQCIATGTSFLNQVKGYAVNPVLQVLTNPALDAGDCIWYVEGASQPVNAIIDKLVIPLDVTDTMEIDFRAYQLPAESGT